MAPNTVFSICFALIMLVIAGDGGVITIQNSSHIVCFTTLADKAPFYVEPPVERPENFFKSGGNLEWTDENDWINCDTTERNCSLGPVLDERWENFGVRRTDYLSLNFSKVLSFSVYKPSGFQLFISDDDDRQRKCDISSSSDNGSPWIHYLVEKEGVHINVAKILRKVKNSFWKTDIKNVKKINIRSNNATYWKIHNYSYKESRIVTQSGPSILRVTPNGASTLVFYTSLCQRCRLKLIVLSANGGRTEKDIYPSRNRIWNENTIEIDTNEGTEILIFRQTEKGNVGYWAIDVAITSFDVTKSLRKKTFQVDDPYSHVCKSLQDGPRVQSDPKLSLCPERGKIGPNCNVQCSTLLGPNFTLCEQHRICNDNFACVCPWGYRSPKCDQRDEKAREDGSRQTGTSRGQSGALRISLYLSFIVVGVAAVV